MTGKKTQNYAKLTKDNKSPAETFKSPNCEEEGEEDDDEEEENSSPP